MVQIDIIPLLTAITDDEYRFTLISLILMSTIDTSSITPYIIPFHNNRQLPQQYQHTSSSSTSYLLPR
jgi:hypothetical protein